MEAKEFLKEWKRMCEYVQECDKCAMDSETCDCSACVLEDDQIDRALKTVKNWSESNLKKTRQSELLKLFPNTEMLFGAADICPVPLEGFGGNGACHDFKMANGIEPASICADCKKAYWLAEVEEKEGGAE